MKKNKGFTLVEVIVVAVIVAIIGTAATVLYSGYIQDTAQETLETVASAAASSANAYYRRTGAILKTDETEKLNIFLGNNDRYTIEIIETPPTIKVTDTKFKNGGSNITTTIDYTK